jgi:hypothetical protein
VGKAIIERIQGYAMTAGRRIILLCLAALALTPAVAKTQSPTGKAAKGRVEATGATNSEKDATDEQCHPPIDPTKPQYIVGYGSLMESSSKRSTEPDAGENLPVVVSGFQRAWNTHGIYPTCYLGVQLSKSATMVAALYRSFPEDGKLGADAREIDYCRVAVDPASIKMLDGSSVPTDSQVWIYVNKPGTLKQADAENPIVQSYVDIVIIGCMELQTRVADSEFDFVEQFVKTTGGWSKHWVNDRLMPRRPYIHQPKAWEIDSRLQILLPEFVKEVRIE